MAAQALPERDALMAMPLTEITTALGTTGLRQRFDAEIERFDTEGRAYLSLAANLVTDLHDGQMRGREPHLNHLFRVAIRLANTEQFDVVDPEQVAIGLLHDSVEDQAERLAGRRLPPEAARTVALERIAEQFGWDISIAIGALTNPLSRDEGDNLAAYHRHKRSALLTVPAIRPTVAAEAAESGVDKKMVYYAHRYLPIVVEEQRLIPRSDTPLLPHAKIFALGELATAEQRFRAVLTAA